jgi:hypothetical protein
LVRSAQVIVGIAVVGEPGVRAPFFLSGGAPLPFSPPPPNCVIVPGNGR